ncbi:phage antirepressor KilAC domain-containing protein [Anaerococcus nagyae]|uniref:phage antirepressor KilAC domain-containing protein n=1 Tax=Anaerococcus nagyae TaxID=1755241 RepID=UPI0032519FFD
MNELKIFESESFGEIRTILDEQGEPWFVGKDVADVLQYSNTRDALARHVDKEDKSDVAIHDGRQNRKQTVINESGLYSLIFSSKMKKAKEFKRWVTSEVLPAIRKHGAYMTDKVIERTLTDPDYLIMLATNLKEEKAKRALAEAENEKNKPKVLFADAVSASSRSCLMGELAKMISQEAIRQGRIDGKIGQNKLFAWMRNNGYLCKSGERKNQPMQQYVEQGLFEMKKGSYVDSRGANVVTTTTKVTGKGQIYFINKFLG